MHLVGFYYKNNSYEAEARSRGLSENWTKPRVPQLLYVKTSSLCHFEA